MVDLSASLTFCLSPFAFTLSHSQELRRKEKGERRKEKGERQKEKGKRRK